MPTPSPIQAQQGISSDEFLAKNPLPKVGGGTGTPNTSSSGMTSDEFLQKNPVPEHSGQDALDSSPSALLSKAWDWANTPPEFIQKLQGNLEDKIKDANSPASLKENLEPSNLPGVSGTIEHAIKSPAAKTAVLGTAKDTLGQATPLTAATLGMSLAGKIPGAIGKLFRAVQVPVSAGFAGQGAVKAAEDMSDPSTHGIAKAAKVGGDLGQSFLGLIGMKGGAHDAIPDLPTPDRVSSMQHDSAMNLQTHLRNVADHERIQAGSAIKAVDDAMDSAGVEIDGENIVKGFIPAQQQMFPEGAKPAPRGLGRVEKAATPEAPPEDAETVAEAAQANKLGMLKSVIGKNYNPSAQNLGLMPEVLKRLRDSGVLPEENAKPWSANQSRMIEHDLMDEARAMKESNPRGAAATKKLAQTIHDAREEAADNAGVGDDFRASNAQWSKYAKTFRESPLNEAMYAPDANGVMRPLSGKNYEFMKRLMKEYPSINQELIKQSLRFHDTASKALEYQGPEATKNKLLSAAGMMAVGQLIKHPFLGIMGAASTGKQTIMSSLARQEAEANFKGMQKMGVKETPASTPLPTKDRAPKMQSEVAPVGAAIGSGRINHEQQKHQHVHMNPVTGQMIYYDGGKWRDLADDSEVPSGATQ